ncbi:MAG: hypothetical protein J6T22_12370 [Bacteroidales bacterium]|nr:hypothetical protein [Bacteroidales bacterium]MBO7617992.1 hypothetical protein [Bacteroidales bacterium]
MKKLALTLAIVLGLGMASYAEGGGLFGQGQAVAEDNNTSLSLYNRDPSMPGLPGDHGLVGNQPAPVGSGIAVLIGLGAAYAFAKKREE